ncbi:MAG: hypothetical protein WCG93_15625 [Paludibacter sp.]
MRKKNVPKKKAERKQQLPKQDYEKLKHSAWEYVVVLGYTQKRAAELTGLTEQTISAWAIEDDWKGQREGRQQSYRTDVDNVKQIIRLTSQRRLDLEHEIHDAQKLTDADLEKALRKESLQIGDELSKLTKTLAGLEKDNKYTLGEFINVMDDIFTNMRQFDEELFVKTIPFQTFYVRKRTQELG